MKSSRNLKALCEEAVDDLKYMKRCDRLTPQLVKSEKKSRNSRQRRGGYSQRFDFQRSEASYYRRESSESSASVGSDKQVHHGVLRSPTSTPENSVQNRPCQQTKKAVEIEQRQTPPIQPCPHPRINISQLVLTTATPDHNPDPLATDRVLRATATGSKLDKYEVREHIGKGSSSVVFYVTHTVDQSEYALKITRLSDNLKMQDKVLREVTKLTKLEHPNIVRCCKSWTEKAPDGWRYMRPWSSTLPVTTTMGSTSTTSSSTHTTSTPTDTHVVSSDLSQSAFGLTSHTADSLVSFSDSVDSQPACPQASHSLLTSETSVGCPKMPPSLPLDPPTCLFIQTELCERDTLRTWLSKNCKEKSRTKNQVFKFFEQILEALVYIHEEGFVHRDLKPSNIYFSQGCIKIGLTKTVAISYAAPTGVDTTHGSADGHSKGSMQAETALYMSPERIKGENCDEKSDMFALGIILFELYYIMHMKDRNQVLTDLHKLEFPPQFEQNHISVTSIVKLLLATNPTERPTADELTRKRSLRNLTKTAKKSKEEYIPV